MPTALFGMGLGSLFALLCTDSDKIGKVLSRTGIALAFLAAAAVAKYLGL